MTNNAGSDLFFFDLISHYIKETYGLNDEELDFISENITEQELEDFIVIATTNEVTFSEKRKAVIVKQKYLKMLYES
jgi:hypothetical protein